MTARTTGLPFGLAWCNLGVMNEQLEFMKLVASRLESARIPYMLTGSVAMAVYAIPRMTRDVDLVVDCTPGDAHRIYELFVVDCYVDEGRVREAIAMRTMFNVIHNELLAKADFIIRKDEPYRETEFGRRRRLEIDGMTVWVVSPEDLLLSKLLWGKESGSELQRRDTRAVILSVGDLDWPYVEKWALDLGVTDVLDGVRR